MSRNIVIIGGMGPQASLKLHQQLLQEAARQGAVNGDDYPQITHISVPVKDFISDETNKASAFTQLIETVQPIVGHTDTVVMACNTAHLLAPEIEQALGIKLQSLIDETVAEIKRKGYKRVGLLASPTTIQSGLYTKPLSDRGVSVAAPDEADCDKLEHIIRNVIACTSSVYDLTRLKALISEMLSQGCEAVILGCTELSVLNRQSQPNIIDPLALITKVILQDADFSVAATRAQ